MTIRELLEVLLKLKEEDGDKIIAISNCDFNIGSYSIWSVDLNKNELVINQYDEELEEGVRRLWKEK